MKELIYTGIFILLGIVLIALLVSMFTPENHEKTPTPKITQEAHIFAPLVYFYP